MQEYSSRQEHREALHKRGSVPSGFRVATTTLQFIPQERPTTTPYRMNLSLILAEQPCRSFGMTLTRNRMPGAPILRARAQLEAEALQGVLINNRIANVCTQDGVEVAGRLLEQLGRAAGLSPDLLLSASTGIIGWRLPVDAMAAALPKLVAELNSGSMATLSEAIMTTDTYPKLRRVELGGGSIVGVAKGAGMIEPNMATMLSFILTDLDIPREMLRAELSAAVERSFNRISVDGDQSTSDMVLMISSARRPAPDRQELAAALREVCGRLAEDVVRNGEGTRHVVRVHVLEAASELQGAAVGKAVLNSPLVKTAVYGNDPNVGRIISALGDYCGNHDITIDPHKVGLAIGEEQVFAAGSFLLDKDKELRLTQYLRDAELRQASGSGPLDYPPHERCVEISLRLGVGEASATVHGSDLSDEYVHINADYRT